MRFTMTGIPVLITLLTFSLSSAASTCSKFFANPVHKNLKIQYSVTVADAPIISQCGGTCHLESAAAFVENISQTALATNYNLIQFMRERANHYLKNNNLRQASVADGYVDVLTGSDAKAALLKIEKQGVVPRHQFRFTDEFLGKIAQLRPGIERSFRDSAGKRLTDMQILNFGVGVVLLAAKTSVDQGGPADINGEPAQALLDDVFDSALGGLRTDPHLEFRALFPRNQNIVIWNNKELSQYNPLNKAIFATMDAAVGLFNRSSFKFSTSPKSMAQIESDLKISLQQNKAVQMSFNKVDALIDEETGFIQLDLPAERAAADRAQNSGRYVDFGHGVVIQGYRADGAGNIEWLLIRDSQGPNAYDQGYLHMHIDYFREFVFGLIFH